MSRADALILGRSLREHIGGRWAISWWVIALSAPFGFIAGLNNMAEVSGSTDIGRWIVVSLIGVVVVVSVLLAAHFTFFRKRAGRPVPIWWVVALGAVAGSSRSAATVWVSAQWDLIVPSAFYAATRMLTGALLGAALLPLAAMLASVIATYLNQRRTLELELRQIEVERMRQSGRTEALREALVSQVEAELTHTSSTLDADDARDMSRRLWESAPLSAAPKVRWRQVLQVAVTHNPYPVVLACVLWTIAAFGSLLLSIGFTRAVLQSVLSIAAIAGCFAAGRWLTARLPRAAVTILIGVILALIAWTGVLAPILVGVRLDELNATSLIVTAVWIPVLVITTGVVVSAVQSGDEVVRRLREAIEGQQVAMDAEAAESARIQQELAAVLHGSVQSRLLAAAAVIRQPAIRGNGDSDPQAALHEALALISEGVASNIPLRSEIEEAIRSWIPLMQISAEGIDSPVPESLRSAVIRVIEEGLSNAYRHGGASEVHVKIATDSDGVRVSVRDNGMGPAATTSPGLGSAVLDSLAPGQWNLTRSLDGATELRVVLKEDHWHRNG